jgi:hypothetical protein
MQMPFNPTSVPTVGGTDIVGHQRMQIFNRP